MAALNHENKKFVQDVKSLVKLLTDFTEKEDNFTTCVDFAVSNLFYHSYPDINISTVKQKIARFHEKFLIHSSLERASAFKLVTDKLTHILDETYKSKRDEYYKVLALLLNLSECSGTLYTYRKPRISDCGSEELEHFDWASYLREDCINNNSLSYSSSEISLSEHGSTNEFPTSEDDSLENLPDPLLRPPPRDDSGLGISPDSASGMSQHFHVHVAPQELIPINSRSKKNPETFYPYWQLKYQKTYGSSPYNIKGMNFTKMYEFMLNEKFFFLIEKKVVVHERNVIKEVLWMLNGVKDLFVIHWDGEKFIPDSHVHLCNLTSKTLSAVLNYFCDYGTKVATLHNFIHNVLKDTSQHCLTYQAYAWAIQENLLNINASICSLDRELRKAVEIFTLLTLKKDTEPLFREIDVLYSIHCHVSSEICYAKEPVVKACKLLHVLWKLLHHYSLLKRDSVSLRITLRIFLRTCRPYFSFLEEIIILGSFKDPFGEFIVKRHDINSTDEAFWESGFSFQSIPQDIEQEFFLKPLLTDILSAGKSLEIMNTINSLLKKVPFRLHAAKVDMYIKFIKVLQKLICRRVKQKTSAEKKDANKNEIVPVIQTPKDPLLEEEIFPLNPVTSKFFQPDINPVYTIVSQKIPENLFSKSHQDLERIIENLEVNSSTPFFISVNKALDTCMMFAYYPIRKKLIKTLREDYKITSHFSVMQKYFLMESGDLMFSFYSEVFEKIFYKQPWLDVSFLYSTLQYAISEDKESSARLCIFLDTQNSEINAKQPLSQLNVMQLSYEVEWPVNMMLGPKVQVEYCQVFSFLLQIKCAKYLLDNLYCTILDKSLSLPQLIKAKMMSTVHITRKQKIHGMYLFRMKLMFFVNGLHNYIMTRILHSFSEEFMNNLEKCHSIDDMLSTHGVYLKRLQDRCLLDKRLFLVKEHILHVLNLCYELQQIWISGIDKVRLEKLQMLEEQFSKHSSFLYSCFNSGLRRGTYPHLESLVNTMLSRTHTFHVFGNLL